MKRFYLIIAAIILACGLRAQEKVTVYDPGLDQNETFDVPEGMTSMMDSLYLQYMVRECIQVDGCESTAADIETDQETYIRRLSHLPNVIEMPYNEVVREFIDRYTKGAGRRNMPYLLGALNFYTPIFEEALEASQLPLELKYLPVIESALNPQATSRSGAAGLWQLMPQTAKNYNLTVNSLVDERRDPVKSSYAAARVLTDLWNIFHDWTLVIAAYNCGPQNVLKAIKRAGGETDFWRLYSYLPKETRGYVPAFIAANYAMTYYCDHGICPGRFSVPEATDTVMVSRDVHLDQIVAMCDISADEIRALNPQYRTGKVPGAAGLCAIRLTQPAVGAFIAAGDSVYNYRSTELLPNRPTVAVSTQTGRGSGTQPVYVTVRNGDTLSKIASRNHTTVAKIKKLNGLRNDRVRKGQKLRVK